jgi:hypothetical protein
MPCSAGFLTVQADTLRTEKAVLCTNISSLYKTARLEIERKDAEIKSLRDVQRCACVANRSGCGSVLCPESTVIGDVTTMTMGTIVLLYHGAGDERKGWQQPQGRGQLCRCFSSALGFTGWTP